MNIAFSFYATWDKKRKKKNEAERGMPFLFGSQKQILQCPQFLVSSEVTSSAGRVLRGGGRNEYLTSYLFPYPI